LTTNAQTKPENFQETF